MEIPLQIAGWVHDVTQQTLGGALVGDHVSGATVLSVTDVSDFEPDGGQVRVAGVVYVYTAAVDAGDVDQVLLTTGLTTAVGDGTAVDVWDGVASKVQTETLAFVQLVGAQSDDDPTIAYLTNPVVPLLPTGPRGGKGETVIVEQRGNRHEVVNVVGQTPVVDASYTNKGTLLTPTAPPAGSPTILAIYGSADSLIVQTDQPEVGAKLIYYVSTVDGFTPDATTQVGPPTPATINQIVVLPDGTPPLQDTVYYVRVLATNTLGNAPNPSPQAAGKLDPTALSTLITSRLITGFILTGTIQVGLITIDAGTGISVPNSLSVPSDGSLIQLIAAVQAKTITIEGLSTFLGSISVQALLNLQAGPVAPKTPPVVTYGWPALVTTTIDPRGLDSLVDDVNNNDRFLTFDHGYNTLIPLSRATMEPLGSPIFGKSWQPNGYGVAICRDRTLTGTAALYYVLTFDNAANVWSIRKLDYQFEVIAQSQCANTFPAQPTLGAYNGRLYMAWANASGGVTLRSWPQSYVGSFDLRGPTGDIADQALIANGYFPTIPDLTTLEVGPADYASVTAILGFRTGGYLRAFTVAGTGVFTRDNTRDFYSTGDESWGLCWDPVAGRYVTRNASTKAVRYGQQIAGTVAKPNLRFAYTLYDDQDSGSGFHETQRSPVFTAAVPKRAYAMLAVPTPSGAELADLDAARTVRLYGTSAATGEPGLLATLPVGTLTATFDTITPGAVPPTTNGFAGVTAGQGVLSADNGGFTVNGNSEGDWPTLRSLIYNREGYQYLAQGTTVSPTSTANSNLNDLTTTFTAYGTEVWEVEIDADVTVMPGTTNIIAVTLDGAESPRLLQTGSNSANGGNIRVHGHMKWAFTVGAGTHTLTFRTRNTAASTSATITATHTVATCRRVK